MLEAKFGDDLSENTISKKEKGGAINGRSVAVYHISKGLYNEDFSEEINSFSNIS